MRRSRWGAEDGAVAATAAITMLALFGTSMLAIDGGNLWSSRRNLITDTDAAALAAARHLVGTDCQASDVDDAEALALEVLADNDTTTQVPSGSPAVVCTVHAGRVSVTAERPTDLTFGGLAGLPEVDVTSTSIAQYGQVVEGRGLRPIAICNRDPHFLELLVETNRLTLDEIAPDGEDSDDGRLRDKVEELLDKDDPVGEDEHPTTGRDGNAYDAEVHRLHFTRSETVAGCGEASGNWGWLDFDGDGKGAGGGFAQVADWIVNGYDGTVIVGENEDCATEVDEEKDCIGEPGAGGKSWEDALEQVHCPAALASDTCVATGLAFPIVLFSTVVCEEPVGGSQVGKGKGGDKGGPDCAGSGGANARYDPDAFVGVILRNWSKITGNENAPSYFDLQFVDPFITSGKIVGTPPGDGPGLIAIQLCGSDFGSTIDDTCVVP